MAVCGLCGHDPVCGSASVTTGEDTVELCHVDNHSCYHQWTVYGRRGFNYVVITSGKAMGKGVLVTQDWDEAVADIRLKVEAGVDVMVRTVART